MLFFDFSKEVWKLRLFMFSVISTNSSPRLAAPAYCGGVEGGSRSGMRHAVAETKMTGETEKDP